MVRQVKPHTRWPSGDRIHLAAIRFSPAQLSERFRITFEEDVDGLGRYKLAAIELPDQSQAWLEHHEGDPSADTLILVDANGDPERALAFVMKALKLSRSDVTWISPHVQSRGTSAIG